jgi:tRNA threonylcarbamoyladenosine modification (KEOPS) complex  Pcc1 subunit
VCFRSRVLGTQLRITPSIKTEVSKKPLMFIAGLLDCIRCAFFSVCRVKSFVQLSLSMKSIWIVFLGLFLLLLSGCIEGEEEIFLSANGAARVVAVYRVPSMLLSAEDAHDLQSSIEAEVGGVKNLTLRTNRVELHNGYRVIMLEITTEDVASLEGALVEHDPTVAMSKGDKILHAIIGRISVSIDGLNVHLNREIHLKTLLDEYLGSSGSSMLGDSAFCYTVHLPGAAESSNAHEVLDDGRTLIWRHRLADCSKAPIHLSVTTSIPIPWWVYLLGGLSVLALLWLLFTLVRKMRPR